MMGTFVFSFVGCFQEAHVGQSSLLTHYMGSVRVNKAMDKSNNEGKNMYVQIEAKTP